MRDPGTKVALDPGKDGIEVPLTTFIRRRIADGDLLTKPPKAAGSRRGRSAEPADA